MSNVSTAIDSGAGYNLAGVDDGAGADMLPFLVPPQLPPAPAAINYDASIKAFTENPDGTFEPIDPIDQLVQLRLTVPDGAIPAMRGVCADYRGRLRGVPAAQQTNVATDETKRVLADVIASGDVTLNQVTVTGAADDGTSAFITVAYTNNRTGATPPPITVQL